jgi:hypothetical protein
MNQPGRPPWPARDRRYDWFRVYNDFVGHPKFRFVATQCGLTISEASMIGLALFVAANKAKPRGWVHDFDPFECGAALDIAPEKVVLVYQELEKQDWITGDYLATWDKRQPDREDPTAAARQQRRRAKLKAIRAGQVNDTSAPVEAGAKPVDADTVGHQYWLMTTGKEIVVARLAIRALAAEMTIGSWRKEAKGDDVALAGIIVAANGEGLIGDAFRNVVAQKIRDLKLSTHPQLPLGMTAIRGGAA